MTSNKPNQLQFSFDILWNGFECEARAFVSSLITNLRIDDIVIESMNVKENAAITSDELLKDYTEKRKIKAPNLWKNSVYYLSYYVLLYFLEVKQIENILLWLMHYKDFQKLVRNRFATRDKKLAMLLRIIV